MAITIHSPLGFTFQGRRENNEDAIYPAALEATVQNRFFIVCDGVGGAQKGELASQITVAGFADYFTEHPSLDFSETVIKSAFAYVLEKFDALLQAQYLLRGMATTLTFVGIGEKDVAAAHIGDSRIYQIRKGRIVFKSEDHSKVNYLLKTGLITEQQAQNHPERNVITRAIQGSHKETEIEINHLSDVQPGDYFFQCTDGVLENLSDKALCEILDSEQTDDKKLQLILNLCEGNTRDNYSGYLIQIADVYESSGAKEWIEPIQIMASKEAESTFELPVATENPRTVEPVPPAKSGQGFWFLGVLALIIGGIAVAYWFFASSKNAQNVAPVHAKLPPAEVKDTVKNLIHTTQSGLKKTPEAFSDTKHITSKTKKVTVTPIDSLAAQSSNGVTANTLSFSKKKNQDTAQKKIPGG